MRDERGAAGMLPILAGLGVAGLTALAASVVSATVVHGRVDAAADLVALAAASQLLSDPNPCATAQRTARDNDVALAECSVAGLAVTVTVAADLPPVLRDALPGRDARARARAELVPGT